MRIQSSDKAKLMNRLRWYHHFEERHKDNKHFNGIWSSEDELDQALIKGNYLTRRAWGKVSLTSYGRDVLQEVS